MRPHTSRTVCVEMLKVECEGCGSPYKVDDRRVPPAGLKMRCPKCGATFVVRKDAGAAEPPAPAPAPAPAAPAAPSLRTAQQKRTMLGVGGLNGPPVIPSGDAPPPPADEPGLPAVAAGLPMAKPAPARPKPPPPPAAHVPPPPLDMMEGFGSLDLGLPEEAADLPAVAPEAGLPALRKAPPPPPPRPAAPKPPPAARPPALDFGELDLPVVSDGAGLPVAAKTKGGGADLPSLANPRADFPSPARGVADFPSPARIDLPTSKSARQITGAALGFGEPDLPILANVPAVAPHTGGGDFGDSFGELDLPLAVDGQRDLPIATERDLHLPIASDSLPIATDQNRHLPARVDADRHLPAPTAADRHLPVPAGIGMDAEEFDVTAESGDDVWPKAPPVPGRVTQKLGSQPPMPPGMDPEIVRQAGGGISFGEVDLGADPNAGASADVGGGGHIAGQVPEFGERPMGGSSEEDMEFGAIPQEAPGPAPAATAAVIEVGAAPAPVRGAGGPGSQVELPHKRSKSVKYLAVGLIAVVGLGAGLAATPYGAFGMHVINDALHSKDNARLLQTNIEQSRKAFGDDTIEGATKAIESFDHAVAQAPRLAPMAAYAAFVGYMREVRFGADPAVHAHSNALLAQATKLSATSDHIALARAAEAVTQGQIAKARADIASLTRKNPEDVDVAILAGELEALAGDHKAALEAWNRAAQLEASPRTAFGRARTRYQLRDYEKAKQETQSVLDRSKQHIGATILMVRILRKTGEDNKALGMLEALLKPGKDKAPGASKGEQVAAQTLLGQINLSHSRMSLSEAAFAEALKLDPKDAEALCGFGEVLFREGRFAEALARYEAAMQANAENVIARVGAAKTKIALERLQDAKEILRKLRESRPADPQVAYWLARVEQALGNKAEVEKILSDAIARAQGGEHVIDLYVALSQHLASVGRTQEADAKIAEARQKLPDSTELRKALGDVHLAAGRLTEAKTEFETVLERDANDLYALFNMGVTMRRLGKFEEAQGIFDKVSGIDKNYPGLALERGVLFETSGQAQRALEMYQEALVKAPNDPDLMLRVGSAQVAAGHANQAEETLRKVLTARPNSAEANHYLGRALLLRGTNLAEALQKLQRAAEIDPNRAEYWLFIGWAANDAGQPQAAQDALRKALELDKSLADAYWQRGVLARRQGAVRDAERDLLKALELKPSRYEAHATLAEVYEETRRWDAAQGSWRKAIAGDPGKAFWHYKLGRLLYTNGNRVEAGDEIAKAVEIALKDARPNWLWEAYMILGDANRASGKRQQAIDYYQEFLKLAPPDSPYRAEVKKALASLGAE